MKFLWNKSSLLFVLLMAIFLSLGAGGYAFGEDEEEEEEPELSDYQQMQIKLIESKLDELLQTDDQNTWYYCMMDLDLPLRWSVHVHSCFQDAGLDIRSVTSNGVSQR